MDCKIYLLAQHMVAIPVNDYMFLGLTDTFNYSQPENQDIEHIHLTKKEREGYVYSLNGNN